MWDGTQVLAGQNTLSGGNLSLPHSCHNTTQIEPDLVLQNFTTKRTSSADQKCPYINQDVSNQREHLYVDLTTFWYSFLALITTIGLLVSLVSNMIIIYLFSRTPMLRRNPSNIIAVNLSLSDLLYCTQWPFVIYCSITQSTWMLEINLFCQTFGFITVSTACASILTVLAMSIERALVIIYSIKAKSRFTNRGAWLVVILIWVFSVASCVPPLLGKFNRFTMDPSKTSCTLDYLSNHPDYKLYILILLVAYWLVPAALITICYTLIMIAFKRSTRSLRRVKASTSNQSHASCRAPNTKSSAGSLRACLSAASSIELPAESVALSNISSDRQKWFPQAQTSACNTDMLNQRKDYLRDSIKSSNFLGDLALTRSAQALEELKGMSLANRGERNNGGAQNAKLECNAKAPAAKNQEELLIGCKQTTNSNRSPHRELDKSHAEIGSHNSNDSWSQSERNIVQSAQWSRCSSRYRKPRMLANTIRSKTLDKINHSLTVDGNTEQQRSRELVDEDEHRTNSSNQFQRQQTVNNLANFRPKLTTKLMDMGLQRPRLSLTSAHSLGLCLAGASAGAHRGNKEDNVQSTSGLTSSSSANLHQSRSMIQYRLARMSFYLILLWFVSWSPIATLAMLNSLLECHRASAIAILIACTMTKLGPAFDVFIYGISHPKIKSKFKEVIMWLLMISHRPEQRNRNETNGGTIISLQPLRLFYRVSTRSATSRLG